MHSRETSLIAIFVSACHCWFLNDRCYNYELMKTNVFIKKNDFSAKFQDRVIKILGDPFA